MHLGPSCRRSASTVRRPVAIVLAPAIGLAEDDVAWHPDTTRIDVSAIAASRLVTDPCPPPRRVWRSVRPATIEFLMERAGPIGVSAGR
jgi:hypothetical protein